MERAKITEILDSEEVPEELAARAYNDLARIHWWLGDTYSVIRAIRNDPRPVTRILDIGCANGTVAESVRRKLSVEVIGVDLKPPVSTFKDYGVPILRADAVRDRLPNADVAFCMHLCHHLSESDLIGLIRNVGRFCRRFILLDLVRHRAPLALFRLFVAPFVCRIVVVDGARSIRRSYTTAELRKLTNTALAGSGSVFTQSVAPFYAHQIIDIAYG